MKLEISWRSQQRLHSREEMTRHSLSKGLDTFRVRDMPHVSQTSFGGQLPILGAYSTSPTSPIQDLKVRHCIIFVLAGACCNLGEFDEFLFPLGIVG